MRAKTDKPRGAIEIRRTVSAAKVKGEENQQRVRWFDPKTKSGKREIPIPSELVAALKAWKEKCPQSRLGLVFCNEFGKHAIEPESGAMG